MEQGDPEEPFNHRIYFLAAMLDPQFGLSWVDLDVHNRESGPAALKTFRDKLKKSLTGGYNYYDCCYYYSYCYDIVISSILFNPVFCMCVYLFPDLFIREVDRDATAAPLAEDAGELCRDSPQPLKHQRLLSRYKAFKIQHSTTCDALTFWSKNPEHFPSTTQCCLNSPLCPCRRGSLSLSLSLSL